ncbi:TPA: integrase arm-type DNA-binding domain-containing protein [Escherichia coli]|nr:integrase arm-type DNA-binding domain-containing protein [Escherichia coli]
MAGDNKLTDKALKAMYGKARERQFTIADGRGLSVRVSKNGAISFVFFFRIGGRESAPVWMTLGKYPDMTLKQAREKRDECRSWLAEGLDPRRENKIKKDNAFNPVTVKDAIDYWFENYAKENRKEIKKGYNKYVNYIFPYIGDYPVDKCSLSDWIKCFDRVRKKAPVQSAAILVELKQIFKFCRVRQYVICNTLNDLMPCDVGKYQEKRDRMLSEKQVSDVWRIYFHEKEKSRAMLYKKRMAVLCLAFGCRLSEARLSTWEEWDFDNWIWTVPKEHSKNGREIVRPVPHKMRQWIVNLHAETKRRVYILGELKSAPAASTEGCSNYITLKHESRWSLHDMRRVFSTGLNDMGIDFFIVEQLLGHSIRGVAGIYNRSRYIPQKLEALNRWIDYLDNLAGVENVVKVLKVRKTA